jgi:hypothetical protein
VKTTVPFFQWLVRQPHFHDGRFSTTYLDGVLVERRGQSFADPTPADEDDAAVAAALGAWFKAHRAAAEIASAEGGAWRRAARIEGRR